MCNKCRTSVIAAMRSAGMSPDTHDPSVHTKRTVSASQCDWIGYHPAEERHHRIWSTGDERYTARRHAEPTTRHHPVAALAPMRDPRTGELPQEILRVAFDAFEAACKANTIEYWRVDREAFEIRQTSPAYVPVRARQAPRSSVPSRRARLPVRRCRYPATRHRLRP
jgi:hypothetical protein